MVRNAPLSGKNWHRGEPGYYPLLFPTVPAGIGQCTIQLLRRHTEITYLRGTLVSSFPFFFVFSVGGGGTFQTRRTNERRTNVFLKLVSTVAIIRTHWDATGARQQSPLCLRRLHTCLQPERTSWKSSMDRTPIQEVEYQSWSSTVFCLTPVCPFLLFLSFFPCSLLR